MEKQHYLFVSYARADLDRVVPVVDAVRKELEFRTVPIEVWMDVSNLQPGESWTSAISDALESSVGVLIFLSPQSVQSDLLHREISLASATKDRLLIPIILHQDLQMPFRLQALQYIDLSGQPTDEQTMSAATKVVDAVARYLRSTPTPRALVGKVDAPIIAADIARKLRSSSEPVEDGSPPRPVFVVHGHSNTALAELERFLTSVEVEPVVLSRRGELAQSLFQKFMAVASKAKFAVVLFSADDYGASRRQYDAQGVGDRALQFRARQNVVLELGFFYGHLGWENVFVVYEDPDQVFPNFERPSDLDGVILDSMSDAAWQRKAV
ncbi:MAG: nucleotide-binding protein [Candidatus Krumholzibacteria bacterium]|nr:nucleotide-binding protein [Candidatus Krumholzibacteria bacterium]